MARAGCQISPGDASTSHLDPASAWGCLLSFHDSSSHLWVTLAPLEPTAMSPCLLLDDLPNAENSTIVMLWPCDLGRGVASV